MFSESPAIGAAGCEEEPGADSLRSPASLTRDARRESNLPIERPEDLGDVDELGLELDNQNNAARRVPGKTIDDSPFAVDREGHLRSQRPSIYLGQPVRECLMERGMASSDDAIELAAAPTKREVGPSIQGKGDRMDLPHRQLIGKAPLNSRHVRLRDPRATRELSLRPPGSDAKRTDSCSKSTCVHARSMSVLPSLGLTDTGDVDSERDSHQFGPER